MSYCFRYRIRMVTAPAIPDDQESVLKVSGLPEIKVRVTNDDHIVGKWVIFKCCGFETEAVARQAGEHFGEVLLTIGAISRLGIDIGLSKTTRQFSNKVHEAWRKISDHEVRTEVHGFMTFEEGTIEIIGMNVRLTVSTTLEILQKNIDFWITRRERLSPRQRNCAALLNDAMLVLAPDSAFILRISAVEALCDDTDVGRDYEWAIESLENHLAGLKMNDQTRGILASHIGRVRKKSVRQSYMNKFQSLLSAEQAKCFDKLYQLRSSLLHDGLSRGELNNSAAEALDLAVALLEADLKDHSASL